jgi:repressor LexA
LFTEQLTEKQRLILEFIEQRLHKNSPPTQREIARHFGLTQNAVYQLICYLKKKGYLLNTEGHRSLKLSGEYRQDKTGIPIAGRVAAGQPLLAVENIENFLDLNEQFTGHKDTFLLRVIGDSMVDEGIMDGDFVAVEPTPTIENGTIAVVLLDGEATVKRVYIQHNRLALKSANRAAGYGIRYIRRNEKDVRIIGKVTGCLRIIK